MSTDLIIPVAAFILFVAGFVVAIRHGAKTEAAIEAMLEATAARVGGQRTEAREGRDRFRRVRGDRWQLELHTRFHGGDGANHSRSSSESVRLRYEVRPPLPGLVVLTNRVHGTFDERVRVLVDMMLGEMMGRAPAASSAGIEAVTLRDDTRGLAHPAAAARFDATALSALRALREVTSCEVFADPAGLVLALQRPPRSVDEAAAWIAAARRLGEALDASGR